MATVVRRTSKEGTITYLVRVRRKGTPPQTASFPTRREAISWSRVIEGAIIEGRRFPTKEERCHTLHNLIARYIDDVLPNKTTFHGRIQRQQLQWWDERLGAYVLSDVTTARIVECRDTLRRVRGPGTVNRYLAVLSHAFTVASREWQWCETNPVNKVTRPKEPRGRVRFLSDEERTRVLDACRESRNPHLYTVVVLALSTGARRGELLSLRWKDINLTRGTITLHDTKNGDRRTLHLTGIALNLMREHAKVRRIDSQWVFPDVSGTKPARIREAWEYAVRRADITDFRFHDLRHTAASYLAMNGASMMELAEILGHKTLSMVKRYTHLSESHTRSVVAKMNAVIFGGQ